MGPLTRIQEIIAQIEERLGAMDLDTSFTSPPESYPAALGRIRAQALDVQYSVRSLKTALVDAQEESNLQESSSETFRVNQANRSGAV